MPIVFLLLVIRQAERWPIGWGWNFLSVLLGRFRLAERFRVARILLKNINRARQLPLLLSVSPTPETDTDSYSIQRVMDDVRFIHYAGFPFSLQLHPAGDELTTSMFEDLDRWIMEQFCGSGAATAS